MKSYPAFLATAKIAEPQVNEREVGGGRGGKCNFEALKKQCCIGDAVNSLIPAPGESLEHPEGFGAVNAIRDPSRAQESKL